MKLMFEREGKRFFSRWLFWVVFSVVVLAVFLINGLPLWLEFTARDKPVHSWRAHSFDAWTKGDDEKTYLVPERKPH